MLSKLQVRNTGFLKLRDFFNYGKQKKVSQISYSEVAVVLFKIGCS